MKPEKYPDPMCSYCQNRKHCCLTSVERYDIPNGATYCRSFVMDNDAFSVYLHTKEES